MIEEFDRILVKALSKEDLRDDERKFLLCPEDRSFRQVDGRGRCA